MKTWISALLLALSASPTASEDFGLDCSWPIHGTESTCGELLGDRFHVYEEYMAGCRAKWGEKGAKRCDSAEKDRLEMSRRQPQSMVNYTSTGFKKLRAPKPLFDLLQNYWNENRDEMQVENWGIGNIYTNNWAADSYMVSVENSKLRGGGPRFKQKIWDAARPTIEEWTGMELSPSSLYGIRVYQEGAVLAPHVDRLPLVSSCIINVDQDVDEPWILEVYDRHDRAVNVTMEPGDMVLYESGSLVHGRPYPLKGRFFANIFIHFEPTGQHLDSKEWEDIDDFFPPYLVTDSEWTDTWARRNPGGWRKHSPSAAGVSRPRAHVAAATGDLEELKRLAGKDKAALTRKDENGWQPLHEAVRAGDVDAVTVLVENGADINAVTNGNQGMSPYNIALMSHSKDHAVARYLASMNAKNIGPEL
mmetsp:Transcript_16020/g.44367  ORF Transcript_16020/g.44367 Transcript_16020/m.44367 type:complete len:419 (-) Transcript_16020:242-1498(-)